MQPAMLARFAIHDQRISNDPKYSQRIPSQRSKFPYIWEYLSGQQLHCVLIDHYVCRGSRSIIQKNNLPLRPPPLIHPHRVTNDQPPHRISHTILEQRSKTSRKKSRPFEDMIDRPQIPALPHSSAIVIGRVVIVAILITKIAPPMRHIIVIAIPATGDDLPGPALEQSRLGRPRPIAVVPHAPELRR